MLEARLNLAGGEMRNEWNHRFAQRDHAPRRWREKGHFQIVMRLLALLPERIRITGDSAGGSARSSLHHRLSSLASPRRKTQGKVAFWHKNLYKFLRLFYVRTKMNSESDLTNDLLFFPVKTEAFSHSDFYEISKLGFLQLKKREAVVTTELIDQIREEENV